MKHKRLHSALISAALLAQLFAGCAAPVEDTTSTKAGAESAAPAASVVQTVAAPEEKDAVQIRLTGSGAQITGSGASESGGVVSITEGGTYTLSGTLTGGRILVNAPKEEVTLILDSVDITSASSSALYIYKAAQVTLWLPDGSSSTLTDGESYSFADEYSSAADDEPNACIYSKAALIIAGSGSLTVNGNYNNGVTGKDTLLLDTAELTVNAKNHGVCGKDSAELQNASLTVVSGGDALRSTNDKDETLGWVSIIDCVLDLTSGEDGVQAETALTVSGGSCSIVSGGGSGAALSDDASAKGLKAGSSVTLMSGSFTLDCADDAVHSNGNVTISGGDFTIATGDDGIHADGTTSISGGSLLITKSYEGIEGKVVEISGGEIDLTASDDGVNATDGSSSGFGGPFSGGSSDCMLHISGGSLTVDASGDGLDSNGSIEISGGTVYISGPTSDGDSALDCDGTAVITGGTVIAAGSSGMAQNFSDSSTQGSILLTFTERSEALIRILDADRTVLAEWTPKKAYSCVVISCPELTLGETYTIIAGGEEQTVTLDTLIYGSGFAMGGMGGGPGGNFPGNGGSFTPPDGDFGDFTPPDSADGERQEMPSGSQNGTPPEKPTGAPDGAAPQKPGNSNASASSDSTSAA